MASLSVFSLEIIGNLKMRAIFFFFLFIKIKTIFLNLAIAFTFIQCLRTVRLYLSLSGPTQTPPLPGPLTCIASRAEDQAQGEEENLWQGSPRSLFSPVPA